MKKIEINLENNLMTMVKIDGEIYFDKNNNFNEKTGNVITITLSDFTELTFPIKLEQTVN